MTPQIHTAHLDTMAWTIDRDGITIIPTDDLQALAAAARQSGVHPAVADVLVDDASPVAPRERAFGLIARRVARYGSNGSTPGTHPSVAHAA